MSDSSSQQNGARTVWAMVRKWALKCVGPVLFVAALSMVDLDKVAKALSMVHPLHVVAAVLLDSLYIFIRSLRWRLLLVSQGVEGAWVEDMRVTTDSIFWGAVTPGKVGEFKRMFHLVNRNGTTHLRAASLCLIDRAFDGLPPLVVLLGTTALLPATADVVPIPLFVSILFLLLLAFVLRRPLLGLLLKVFSVLLPGARPHVEEMVRDLSDLPTWVFIKMLLISAVCFALYVAIMWVLAQGLPFDLGLLKTSQCVAATMLVAWLPITFYNLGTRELVLMSLFTIYGLSMDNAVGFAMLFLLVYLIAMASSWGQARIFAWLDKG